MIPDAVIEQIKEQADVVALVGARVSLRRSGKDFVGLCPFHGERTPSFWVVPNKRMWHCFGCGLSGDIIDFFVKLDGKSFLETVKEIGAQVGVDADETKLTPEDRQRLARIENLAELMDRVVGFYQRHLLSPHGAEVVDYIGQRKIRMETAEKFHLGYAGASGTMLVENLKKHDVSLDLAVEAGLVVQYEDRVYDRFYRRLVTPIRIPRPPNGRSIALAGRTLIKVQPQGSKTPKYINSPQTPLYHKGSVVYGLDLARNSIRKKEVAVFVEGYFDVIALHQAGLENVVGGCGTAVTEAQLDLLMRTGARQILFLFDGDGAGAAASAKIALLCARTQTPGLVGFMPPGLDPDELASQEGLDGVEQVLSRAKPAIEVVIDDRFSTLPAYPTIEQRVRIVEDLREILLSTPAGLSRTLYVETVASKLDLSPKQVESALFQTQIVGTEETIRASEIQELLREIDKTNDKNRHRGQGLVPDWLRGKLERLLKKASEQNQAKSLESADSQ